MQADFTLTKAARGFYGATSLSSRKKKKLKCRLWSKVHNQCHRNNWDLSTYFILKANVLLFCSIRAVNLGDVTVSITTKCDTT